MQFYFDAGGGLTKFGFSGSKGENKCELERLNPPDRYVYSELPMTIRDKLIEDAMARKRPPRIFCPMSVSDGYQPAGDQPLPFTGTRKPRQRQSP
jgi:hypothetical protein